jgi:hypothetical protein
MAKNDTFDLMSKFIFHPSLQSSDAIPKALSLDTPNNSAEQHHLPTGHEVARFQDVACL